MSKSDRFGGVLAGLLLLALALPAVAQVNKYDLGHQATPAEIAGWDIDVRPDGAGLPEGQGSVAQGNDRYDASCAVCHGTFGESNEYIPLTGIENRVAHATTLFDYINRAMPFSHSKSLTADEVYAVTAYVLNLNNIVAVDFVANRETLPKVEMPARDKMKPYPGLMSIDGKPDVHNVACMKDCAKEVEVTARLPAGFVENLYGDIRDNFRDFSSLKKSGATAASTPVEAAGGAELIQTYGCVACHAVDHKIVGPALRDVAVKYQGDSGATAQLTGKIRDGGAGVWGTIPMPPQPAPSDSDLATLVQWILTLSPGD